MSSFNENAASEPEPEFRLLKDESRQVLVQLSVDDLGCLLVGQIPPKLRARLEKAKGLLEYSTKRENYVQGKKSGT